ncbi:transcription factor [Pichia kluyveri]|uniref:Transcription factor MBP1 n=1 Tax=Pichia kluyveri TaxID=36015 RepID=A0AAV5R5D0_PICKL|nr:transcription factor [Pichia kluyveri]
MIHENLYSATYSGVAVYEFIHPKSSVMRRKKDGWVNATHILKVANFPKAKRTRILEKDVQTGIHEKVQGGYGKYQGTWVPLKRAIEIAQQFGVLNELNPIFDYISNNSITPPPAPKHHHSTTANGTRKQRINNNTNNNNNKVKTITKKDETNIRNNDENNPNDTTKPKSSTKAKQKSKSNNQTSDTPTKSTRKYKRQKISNIKTDSSLNDLSIPNQINDQQNNLPINNSKNSLQLPSFNNMNLSLNSVPVHGMGISNMNSMNSMNNNNMNNMMMMNSNNNFDQRRTLKAPKGLMSPSSLTYSPYNNINNNNNLEADLDDELEDDENEQNNLNDNNNRQLESLYRRLHEPSTVEFMSEHDIDKALAESETYGNESKRSLQNDSFFKNSKQFNMSPSSSIKENQKISIQKQQPQLDKSFVKLLYNYFIELDSNSNCEMPYFITNESKDFNINQPIDNQGNTALHWACSMGDYKMCEILINRNANTQLLNNQGEEPLVRSVIYANCYTRRTFSKLLDLFNNNLLNLDYNSRTLLHHIAIATSDNNNLPSSRYYTEILLRKIAENVDNINFKKFIDKQDINGNTALHIFSYNNAKKCIKILLGFNARIDIGNKSNNLVSDYLSENFKNDMNLHNNNNNINNLNQNTLHNDENNEIGESFSLRPFKPMLQPITDNNSIRQDNFKITNSILDPFQISTSNNLLNFGQSTFLPNLLMSFNQNKSNYLSTTSMKMNQLSIEMVNKLNDLSNSFDSEIKQKSDDIKELTSIVETMNNDIEKINNESNELLESVSVNRNDDNILKDKLILLDNEFNEKETILKKLIDRSQAMDLAKIVQKCENQSLSKIDNNDNINDNIKNKPISNDLIFKLIELTKSQIIRKKSVEKIVDINSISDTNKNIITSYRKLVSKLSNMPINEVDYSLNSIEECLKRDLGRDIVLNMEEAK